MALWMSIENTLVCSQGHSSTPSVGEDDTHTFSWGDRQDTVMFLLLLGPFLYPKHPRGLLRICVKKSKMTQTLPRTLHRNPKKLGGNMREHPSLWLWVVGQLLSWGSLWVGLFWDSINICP